ncbi:M17 family metallopeptidase [[Mycoplasma] mobile]|uniref:Probable cytosol aminopeptidase n=1 Tax=Mycoplasma mobile (strain ATCC 43663 / 163K / NCTC 11711) TaxID=267748 RepID=Q6KHI1_MYCM1|nr:peptidase M17 [[Mycoplasma] mobile]AAT27949.1 leucyl aminopeptidase [Mycoplasma mobile 163K]
MFKILKSIEKSSFQITGIFKNSEKEYLIAKKYEITEFFNENKAYIYLGNKSKFNKDRAKKAIQAILSYLEKRAAIINFNEMINEEVSLEYLVTKTLDAYIFKFGDLYINKTSKSSKKPDLEVFLEPKNYSQELEKEISKTEILAKAVNYARKYQAMPPNICNSEFLASEIETFTNEHLPNVIVKVLNKTEITNLGMNLLLAVNKGSKYEPRVVVLEYRGNPSSEEKTVIVGKGITFDSGGYSLKPAAAMIGMKYDMSGAIISAAAIHALSQLEAKANFSAVLTITDNRVNGDANLPDAIWKSMNGKTVEVNNTDAEGRLVMADGLTYAIRNLGATKLIDISTLTGAMKYALGNTYTGVWTTKDSDWDKFAKAATIQEENVWRMPLHEDFAEGIRKSEYADLINTDLSGSAGSSSAAMFLKEFTEDKDYIHIDIAGTAESGNKPKGPMVKTLVELALMGK